MRNVRGAISRQKRKRIHQRLKQRQQTTRPEHMNINARPHKDCAYRGVNQKQLQAHLFYRCRQGKYYYLASIAWPTVLGEKNTNGTQGPQKKSRRAYSKTWHTTHVGNAGHATLETGQRSRKTYGTSYDASYGAKESKHRHKKKQGVNKRNHPTHTRTSHANKNTSPKPNPTDNAWRHRSRTARTPRLRHGEPKRDTRGNGRNYMGLMNFVKWNAELMVWKRTKQCAKINNRKKI